MKFPVILERTTAIYHATVGDEQYQPLPMELLTSLTLTFYDLSTGCIINGRNGQNVLNTNNVTVDSAGQLEWRLDPADTGLIDQSNKTEIRVALFTWTWGNPGKTGRYEVRLTIKNLIKVT